MELFPSGLFGPWVFPPGPVRLMLPLSPPLSGLPGLKCMVPSLTPLGICQKGLVIVYTSADDGLLGLEGTAFSIPTSSSGLPPPTFGLPVPEGTALSVPPPAFGPSGLNAKVFPLPVPEFNNPPPLPLSGEAFR